MLRPKTLLIIAIILSLSLSLPLQGRQFARWYTSMGSFTSDLRDEIVPITANNFIDLTNSGFYDGLVFHRVVVGFVIQDGDPLGTGYGGPGYTIPDEFSPLLHHDSPGVLAMAHTSAPNSAGSQYYITLAPTPNLDGNYAIFGKVFEGLDVVLDIGNVPVDGNDHPVTDVYIDSLRILDLSIYGVSPPTDTVVEFDASDPTLFVVEAFNTDLTVQFEWFIDDIPQPEFTDLMMEPSFTSNGMHTVKCVTSTSEVTWTTEWQVNVSSVENQDEVVSQSDLRLISLVPNPFNAITNLSFNLRIAGSVNLSVYDVKGRIVKSEEMAGKTGINDWNWDGINDNGQKLASGIYFIKLKTASAHIVQKAVFLK